MQRERSLAKPEQTHADCHQAVAGAWRPWPTRRSAVRLYEVQRALGLAGDVTAASPPASNQVELALGPEAVFRHTSPRSHWQPLADDLQRAAKARPHGGFVRCRLCSSELRPSDGRVGADPSLISCLTEASRQTMDRSQTGMPAAAKRSKLRPMAPRERAASTVSSLEPLCEVAQRWFDAPLWAARSTRRCGVSTALPAAMRRSAR